MDDAVERAARDVTLLILITRFRSPTLLFSPKNQVRSFLAAGTVPRNGY